MSFSSGMEHFRFSGRHSRFARSISIVFDPIGEPGRLAAGAVARTIAGPRPAIAEWHGRKETFHGPGQA